MTTDFNTNDTSTSPASPSRTSEVPTKPANVGSGGSGRLDKLADRLAHKGNKTEQNFDADNHEKFSK